MHLKVSEALTEFLPRNTGRYSHSVKSHLNVHSIALTLISYLGEYPYEYENLKFSAKLPKMI